MRIVLVGAVESSLLALQTMAANGHKPVAVVTLPLLKASRHSDFVDLRPAALIIGVPVIETSDINAAATLDAIRSLAPDYVMVIGWSQLCKREFIEIAKAGCLGYHPSLLPENRGRALIVWTILQGIERSGGTLFWLGSGADDGDIFLQNSLQISADETARSLMDKHLDLMARTLADAMPILASGQAQRIPQDESKATYCARRTPEDGWIDWVRPAHEIWTLVRATGRPYPGAFTEYRQRRLIVWSADLVSDRKFWGLPGQVQAISESGVLVQCGDREHIL